MDKVLTHAAASAAKKYVAQKSFESGNKFVENLLCHFWIGVVHLPHHLRLCSIILVVS